MSSRKVFRWATLLLVCCVVAGSGWLFCYAETRAPAVSTASVTVMIPRRASATEIGRILAAASLIHADIRFLILARLSGYSKRFQAGEFRLTTGLKPLAVMRQLSEAQPVEHPVTIPEGLRAEEIAEIFAKGKWCDFNRFLHLVHDPAFIKSLGVGQPASLEGYLFPDTYDLTRLSSNAKSIIRMMVGHFKKIWAKLTRNGTGTLGLQQTVTLASIVEKETADPAERPMIASVFLNRLRLGMRLQSDPTVIYGLKNFTGNLTKEDLQHYTPYNTYLIPGLPPGPICNPGEAALAAVLRPDKGSYLYFVSKNDGTHQFSKTLAEQNRAVWKYQKEKKTGKKKKIH